MKYTGPLEKRPIIAPANAPDGNLRFVHIRLNHFPLLIDIVTGYI